MKKPSFLKREAPPLVCMAQGYTAKRIQELIQAGAADGAEAFGIQLERLEPQYRNEKTYRRLFETASPLPVYVTNYRSYGNSDKSDSQLAEELIGLAECGATLCDVMGDIFDACEGELTENEQAVERQIKLIERLHSAGAEVLMSSHILSFTPAERVLKIALEHQRRGADISKIVTGASDMAEQIENLRIINLLKEKLEIPFLFLSGGECHISRRLGASLGNCMTLCVQEYDELSTAAQPRLTDMKILRNMMEDKKV